MGSEEDGSTESDSVEEWVSDLYERAPPARQVLRWASRSYIVMIVIGVVLGLQVAPVVTEFARQPAEGTVAVVPLEGGIDGGNAESVVTRLKQARQDPSVDAVVLLVNSGGGGAAASEAIYTAVRRTAKRMPVVVSVNAIAASGAYYSSVPAEVIYVKPASLVGSVGVRFVAPIDIPPVDILVKTGPNKLTGGDLRDWTYSVESVKRAFLSAVVENREPKGLELTPTEISYAKLYSGGEAVDNGLADRIGSVEDAIKHAAKLAGLARHRVKVIGYTGTVSFVTKTAYEATSVEDKELRQPTSIIRDPADVTVPQVLMLPPSVIREALEEHLADHAVSVEEATGSSAVTNATEVTPDGTPTG